MTEQGTQPAASDRGVVAALAGMTMIAAATTAAVIVGWVPWSGLLEQVLAELLVVTGLGTIAAIWRGVRHRPRQPVDPPSGPTPG